MDEKEKQEFTLEDILQEFGSDSQTPDAPADTETPDADALLDELLGSPLPPSDEGGVTAQAVTEGENPPAESVGDDAHIVPETAPPTDDTVRLFDPEEELPPAQRESTWDAHTIRIDLPPEYLEDTADTPSEPVGDGSPVPPDDALSADTVVLPNVGDDAHIVPPADDTVRVFNPEEELPPAQRESTWDAHTIRIDLPPEYLENTADTPSEPVGDGSPVPPDDALTGDTIVLPNVGGTPLPPSDEGGVTAQAVTEGENPVADAMSGDTVVLPNVGDDAPASPEPYSDRWEPDYEEPIAEYVPPRPIEFRPRNRLRELKKELVAGPERMYYTLSEKGLGKLQFAIFIMLLVVLASAASTVFYVLGMVGQNRMKFMVFVQFMSLLVSALLGSFQLLDGAADLFRGRFSLNTLLCFSFLFCCVDGIFCLQALRLPCCAGFSLLVLMSLWGEYHKRNTRLGALDTMRKATRLDSLGAVEDYHEGRKGLLRGEGQVKDFMDSLDGTSTPETVLSVYALVALLVSVGLGVTAAILHRDVPTGFQVAAVTTLAAMPASVFVTLSRPMAVLERRLHKLGVVLCGWKGVVSLCGKAFFPVTHDDMFPVGSVKLNGMKFFGSHQPDLVISYAAALAKEDGGTLEPLFTHLLDSRNGIHYDVEAFHAYDNGGVGGEVGGLPVLMGPLPFLKEMGVEVPEGIRVTRAVCVAVDGELSGLFATTYEADWSAASGLSTLTGYRGLTPAMVSDDMMVGGEFIRELFRVRPKRILLPDHETRKALRAKQPEDMAAAALITGQGLAPFAFAVTGARTLRSACNTGVTIHMIGGILGMAAMAVLAVLGAMEYLTPANLFAYQLVWMIPGLLITSWTRTL